MKQVKGLCLLSFIAVAVAVAFAKQGNTQVVVPQKAAIKPALPDLTFDLMPVIEYDGSNHKLKTDAHGQLTLKLSFIVKNIGFANSASAQIYAEYFFNSSENRTTIVSVQSSHIEIPAIEKGKDKLIEQRAFTFTTIPEQAFGKELKLRLKIVANGAGSQKEYSFQNNTSAEIPFSIDR